MSKTSVKILRPRCASSVVCQALSSKRMLDCKQLVKDRRVLVTLAQDDEFCEGTNSCSAEIGADGVHPSASATMTVKPTKSTHGKQIRQFSGCVADTPCCLLSDVQILGCMMSHPVFQLFVDKVRHHVEKRKKQKKVKIVIK